MSNTLCKSEVLFEQIKTKFVQSQKADIVIKISDAPMNEWEVVHFHSFEDMYAIRSELTHAQAPFAGFVNFDGHYVIFFSDKNLFKCQNLDTGEIVDFDDRTFSSFDVDALIEEVKQFQG